MRKWELVSKFTSYFVTAKKKKIQRTKEDKIRGGSRRKGSHWRYRCVPNHSTQTLEWSFTGLVWARFISFATFSHLNFLFWKIFNLKNNWNNITVKIPLYFTQIHQLLISSCVLAFSKPPSSLPDPHQPFESILQTSWLNFTPKYYSKYPLKAS